MEVFVARQPIFDKDKEVYGYELLYRRGTANNFFENTDHDMATSDVITNSFLVIGIKNLTNGSKAFINFTENLIKGEVSTLLPKDHLVLEILETIEPDTELIESCKNLKEQGFMFALDDFVFDKKYEPLIELADIIKIDFLNSDEKYQRSIVQKYSSQNIKFLAEKIETIDDYEKAVRFGYSYFQGYFFSKPVIISGRNIPQNKVSCLQLIKIISDIEPDFLKMAKVIEKDLSLSFELLKLVNSAAFAHRNQITSINHALTMLGLVEIKKWIYLVALRKMATDKPPEILRYSLIRAKFCEIIAPHVGLESRNQELFMMGLFSMIDVLMDRPLSELLNDLPISDDIKDALLGKNGILRNILELIMSFENGEWLKLWAYTNIIKIQEEKVARIFYDSIDWSNLLIDS